MEPPIRPARRDDLAAIGDFAQNTFDWGDYVVDRFPAWLDEPDSLVVVAVDAGDRPVGLARGVMLSDQELWLSAARVAPAQRGRGMGGRMNETLISWGAGRGARVVRLLIEAWNTAAQRQVDKNGYRPVSDWVWAERETEPEPSPAGNGGLPTAGPERLRKAPASEADPAYMAWSASELMTAGRGLFGRAWAFRRLTPEDLRQGARRGDFLMAPSGWILADSSAAGMLQVSWLMAAEADYRRLIRATIDRARARRCAAVRMFLPAVTDLVSAAERSGCRIHPMTVWERPI